MGIMVKLSFYYFLNIVESQLPLKSFLKKMESKSFLVFLFF
jgi:hypothetical protein